MEFAASKEKAMLDMDADMLGDLIAAVEKRKTH